MARVSVKPPIGPRLRFLRERAGMTQLQLAEAADVADGTISRVERGRIASPSLEFAEKLARALRIPVAELFEPTKKTVADGLRPCDRPLLAVVRDLEESDVDDVLRAIQLLIAVGRRR